MSQFNKSVLVIGVLFLSQFISNPISAQAQTISQNLSNLCKTVSPNTSGTMAAIFTSAYNKLPTTDRVHKAFPWYINTILYTDVLDAFLPKGVSVDSAITNGTKSLEGTDYATTLINNLTTLVQSPLPKWVKKKVLKAVKETIDEQSSEMAKKYGLTTTEKYASFWALETGEIKLRLDTLTYIPQSTRQFRFGAAIDSAVTKTALNISYGSTILACDPAFYPGVYNLFFQYLSDLADQSTQSTSIQTPTKPTVNGMKKVANASTPNTFSVTGVHLYPYNAINLTFVSLAEENIGLVATPQSFGNLVSNFFGGIWSFFVNLVPNTHGQTSGDSYVIDNIPTDSSIGASMTFSIPTSTPNGVYSVSLGILDDSNATLGDSWLSTNYKLTINSSGATVSGGSGSSGSLYTDGMTMPATYSCPATATNIPVGYSGYLYILSGNVCTPYATIGSGGSGMSNITICPAGQVSVGGICVLASRLAKAATAICPTVPTGVNGYFALVSGATCVFHASTGIITTTGGTLTSTTTSTTTAPISTSTPTTTTIPATAIYACSTGTLSGTNCIITTAATSKYICPTGATLSGTSCTTTYAIIAAKVTSYGWSSSRPNSYSCPSGYVIKNTYSCYKSPTITSATQTYSCPVGYTTQGSSCTSTYTPAPSYSCPTGYILNSTTKTCTQG